MSTSSSESLRPVAGAATQDDERAQLIHFRSAFEGAAIGMAIVDATGLVLRVNAALEQKILGYGPGELLGRHVAELTHPDDHAADGEAWRTVAEDGVATVEHERRYRHRNGYWVWCLLSLSAVHDEGRVLQFVLQVQDVTQKRIIEQFVRENESRYRSLVEHLPLVTYRDRLDADGSNLYSSPQIEDLLGHPVQDWIDDPFLFRRIVHPDDRERVMAEIRRCNESLEDFACEFRTVAADGRTATVFKEGVVVRDEDGVPLYRQGYLLDVTERRALEEQLRLAQKLESVGQLAAGIAHEINTPIQYVSDSMTFVREAVADLFRLGGVVVAAAGEMPGPDGEQLRRRIRAAEDAADVEYLRERLPAAFERTAEGIDRVASIVRAMKAFAHPSVGPHAPVDLNQSIRTTVVVARAEYKYVADVVLDLDETLPLVPGDAGELNQVLLNLVVNAGHAITDTQTEDSPRGTIWITTAQRDGAVAVTVRDTGGGIPDAIRERIFDPFFTTKAVGRGTGQGLAITRSIVVDHHHGHIDVQSPPGEGAAITVVLPLESPATTHAEAA